MDRLETRNDKGYLSLNKDIYIPVWIDQKQNKYCNILQYEKNLHSSMDRLETRLHPTSYDNLHSSMDRLETRIKREKNKREQRFTFQYGQIRNSLLKLAPPANTAFTFQYGQIRNMN